MFLGPSIRLFVSLSARLLKKLRTDFGDFFEGRGIAPGPSILVAIRTQEFFLRFSKISYELNA